MKAKSFSSNLIGQEYIQFSSDLIGRKYIYLLSDLIGRKNYTFRATSLKNMKMLLWNKNLYRRRERYTQFNNANVYFPGRLRRREMFERRGSHVVDGNFAFACWLFLMCFSILTMSIFGIIIWGPHHNLS